MAQKSFEVTGLGPILIVKRRGAKNLRISVTPHSRVRVSQPTWLPYEAGLRFVRSKANWIKSHQQKLPAKSFQGGDLIGKSYRLRLVPANGKRASSRIKADELRVNLPASLSQAARRAAIARAVDKALKLDSQTLLAPRLAQLSQVHGLKYRSFRTKRMRSRWGSCSSSKDISLSIYLVQLPWHLIDYVLLHELAHTEIMNHGPLFWQRLIRALPDAKALQKQIRAYQPSMSED